MADWRKLAMETILADGEIDDAEVRILKKELFADAEIDSEEVQFLIELRNKAQKRAKTNATEVNPKFETLFFKAIQQNVLRDGKIDAEEANWLRTMLFADRKIDENEKKFLKRMKKEATHVSPEFEQLYQECVAR
ncbi:MAG: tellurite resistance TerB family protein [Gemmataceae bacterium]